MNKDEKIYVAGCSGLVGSAFLRKLSEKGYSNLALRDYPELDLRDQTAADAYVAHIKPAYILCAAAKVGGIVANNTYRAEFIYDNLMIAANIIHAAYRNGVKKLLNLGSSCIYPRVATQPLKEDYLLTGLLEPTNEPYAIAKIAAIKLCTSYNYQYGTNYISVMPTNLYGPDDNFNLETAHVLPALMRKIHIAKLCRSRHFSAIRDDIARYPLGFGLPRIYKQDSEIIEALRDLGITADRVTLWGTGEPYREFLYVDDMADACVYLMENRDATDIGDFVNIGAGEDRKIKELADVVRRTVGFEGEIEFDRVKPDGMPRKLLDCSRMTQLGWSASIKLEEGLGETYKWYTFARP